MRRSEDGVSVNGFDLYRDSAPGKLYHLGQRSKRIDIYLRQSQSKMSASTSPDGLPLLSLAVVVERIVLGI